MTHIFQKAKSLLEQGMDIAVATIIEREGSAPRDVGARMLVYGDNLIVGTIGGGVLEGNVIQECLSALIDKESRIKEYHFDAKEASDAGMICGGAVKVLIQFWGIGDMNRKHMLEQYERCLQHGDQALYLIWFDEQDLSFPKIHESLTSSAGLLFGDFPPKKLNIENLTENLKNSVGRLTTINGITLFPDFIEELDTVIIFGAGHVGKMLASLTNWVGFRTIIVDDRTEFANQANFPKADEVLVPGSMANAFDSLKISPRSLIVIVTRGHLDDQVVLEQALKTDSGYIGMIGSRRKCNLIFKSLLEKGFSQVDLDRVNAPIGLSIGAETPEEIAISILAELIQSRASRKQ